MLCVDILLQAIFVDEVGEEVQYPSQGCVICRPVKTQVKRSTTARRAFKHVVN